MTFFFEKTDQVGQNEREIMYTRTIYLSMSYVDPIGTEILFLKIRLSPDIGL